MSKLLIPQSMEEEVKEYMSDLVSCSRCGKIHPRGYICNVGRNYERTDEDRLRDQRRWKAKANQIKRDDLNLCAVCRDKDIYTYDTLEVHHIIKIRIAPEKWLDDDNLITLCRYHHRQADDGEIEADYLRELTKKRG